MTGDIAMGENKVTGLGGPTAQDDALRKARAEILNADIHSDAGIAITKLCLALAITHAHIATANKDGTTATPSMRTLGAGAQQAAAGNHTHTFEEDITGSGVAGSFVDSSATYWQCKPGLLQDEDLDLATTTDTFAAISHAVAVAFACGNAQLGNRLKLQVIMA
ncbi:unnamed protein product, partial [marine sediment metagenome]